MPLRIIGRACPFNVDNSFKECFAPGAFDEFLASPEAKNLPMNVMHDQGRVGTWSALHVAGDWLHCLGVLDHADTEYKVRHRELADLSISFADQDYVDTYRAAKSKEDRKKVHMEYSRAGRAIDGAATELSKMPALEALQIMAKLNGLSREDGESLMAAIAHKRMERQTVKRAILAEISIVNNGAFKNTGFHWEKI